MKQLSSKPFTNFHPRTYLDEYYNKIDHENHSLLEFFADAYGNVKDDALLLEFGGGPTIYQLISAAGKVKEIHFADYLEDNLEEVKKWHICHPEAFDWSDFFHRALELEGHVDPKAAATEREEALRSKITKFIKGDAHQEHPLGSSIKEHYDALSVHFVPESITDSKEAWRKAVRNISGLLKPGGVLIMSAILEASHWRSGEHAFPATHITKEELLEILKELGFYNVKYRQIESEVTDELSTDYSGYKGMIFVSAVKNLEKA